MGERSVFEQQREALLKEIGIVSYLRLCCLNEGLLLTVVFKSFEHVLANINKLNRSLEGVIAVSLESNCVCWIEHADSSFRLAMNLAQLRHYGHSSKM